MVDFSQTLEVIGGIFNALLYGAIALVLLGILGGMIAYIYWRGRFDIQVRILSTRAEDKYKNMFDKGGIILDPKDGYKYLRLLKTKKEIPYPPFNILQLSNKGDYLEIWRKSEDEFVYLTPGTINKIYGVNATDGKKYYLGKADHKQIQGDIKWWNIKKKNQIRNIFAEESVLMRLLPYIPHAIGGVILIFLVWIVIGRLPELIGHIEGLVKELREYNQAGQITIRTIRSLIWKT